MSAPIPKGGKPTAFGAKLRIYAAHNPTILQMVANLSMPLYYRFHFPTWMETHKGLKNCFCPLFLPVTLRGWGQGDDRSIFFIRLVSDRAERSGDVYSRFFSTIPVSLRKECRNRASKIEWHSLQREKAAMIDQTRKWMNEFFHI